MTKWPWIERTFNFDYPATKWPDLLERVRGTPTRIEELVRGLDGETLTYHDGYGWSVQENIGHLLDTEFLPLTRIEEILAGKSVLTAADMSNRMTNEADHNAKDINDLLAEFRNEREKLATCFEQLDEADWDKAASHPRLEQPTRIVDIANFTGEHDDYHLARIRQLIRAKA